MKESEFSKFGFKKPKHFGRNEDGYYLAVAEAIGLRTGFRLFGKTIIKEGKKTLYISNRKTEAWIFSLITGYCQIGTFDVDSKTEIFEGDNIIVKINNNKIVQVFKQTDAIYEEIK